MTNFGSSMPGKGKCGKQLKAKTKIGPPGLLWNILSTLRVPPILLANKPHPFSNLFG